MNHAPSFQDAVRPLLERIGLPIPDGDQRLSVTLAVDEGLTVALLGHQEGFLVAIAEIEEPLNVGSAERLLPLLAENRFTAAHPALIGTVDPSSGRISLWTRLALSEIAGQNFITVFDRLLAAASAVRDWVQTPATASRPVAVHELRA